MRYNENIILSYTDRDTYIKGLEYYNKNVLEDFTVQILPTDNSTVNRYSIDTWVPSMKDENEYNVQVAFNDSSGFTCFHCDCAYFKGSYRRKGLCEHLVAVLLKYFKEKSRLIVRERREFQAQKLLNKFNNILEEEQKEKLPINLGIHYYYYGSERIKSYGEIRIGTSRLYILKDVEAFIEAVIEGRSYTVSKMFTYNPFCQEFTEDGEKIIDFLKEIYELNQINRIGADYSRNRIKLLEGRKFYIPSRQLKRFLHISSKNLTNVTINERELGAIPFYEKEIPFTFEISKLDKDIEIKHQGELPLPLEEDKEIFYYKDALYRPSKEKVKFYSLLKEVFGCEESPKIRVKEEEESFGGYIIPLLKNISKNLYIHREVDDIYYTHDLRAEAYIDRRGNRIYIRLIYNYGDKSIVMPQENLSVDRDTRYVIRDMIKEKEIEGLLGRLGFEASEDEYILLGEDEEISFLNKGVGELKELCEVYYSDSFKALRVYDYKSFNVKLGLNKSNLLKVDFTLKDLPEEDLKRIFKAIKQQKKYYRLTDGSFLELESNELKRLLNLLDKLGIKKDNLVNNNAQLPLYMALSAEKLGELFSLEGLTFDAEATSRLKEIKEPLNQEFLVPESLKAVLRDYQLTGYKYLKYLSEKGLGGILADEMGLGKTLQAIALILSDREKGPSIVVAPTSLVYNWKEEISKFAPELTVTIAEGTPEKRGELIKNTENYDVIITSYALIRKDIDHYKTLDFNLCIIDEAQYIKNPYSQNAASVKEIKSRARFALTGTPIENSLSELWSIFDFILPGYLLSLDSFNSVFLGPITKESGTEAFEKLNALIKPFILRRVKKDVAKELPEKIYHKFYVTMTPEQKKLYTSYLAAVSKDIRKEIQLQGFEKNRIKILGALTRLRQICCDPSVFVEGYEGGSGKLEALRELLAQALEEGHKILIFSQFTSILKNIGILLKKNNEAFFYLDGTTSPEERISLVESFNNQKEVGVFLISLKAGGTGLNLTSADLVIHYDPWWNPAVEEQATDRAHRIGQENTVEVIKLITKGTIEEKINRLQEKKSKLIYKVLSKEEGQGFISSFTENDLLELIAPSE